MTIKNLGRQLPFTESRKAVNENFAALVEHLGEKAEIVVGTYTGDGAASREIELGFQPKAVLLFCKNGFGSFSRTYYGGLAFPGYPVVTTNDKDVLSVTNTGFQTYFSYVSGSHEVLSNGQGYTMYYLAIR